MLIPRYVGKSLASLFVEQISMFVLTKVSFVVILRRTNLFAHVACNDAHLSASAHRRRAIVRPGAAACGAAGRRTAARICTRLGGDLRGMAGAARRHRRLRK